ncbi:MAG: hypothetical protein HY234_06395 [Acidobacteria bacterium]|nr:hypothetical protein [Acidobacteriota bacterium]MBI3662663.1 hypothetical protein [Acidobacteriota bacterium]
MTRWSSLVWVFCVGMALGLVGPAAEAQSRLSLPPPLSLTGTLTAGYYHSGSQDGVNTSRDAGLGSVRLKFSGYFHHPRFLTFEIKPQFSMGRQSNESVFPDGRGISFSSTFLGGSTFPLTVSYTRLSRQVTTFGTLDRLAGLQADTSQSAFSLNWRLAFRRLPRVNLTYSRYSDNYEPLAPLTSKVANRARTFSVDLQYERGGWLLDSQFRTERTNTGLLNIFQPGLAPYLMTGRIREFRASASREFSRAVRLNLLGGRTKSQNEIAARPYDQSYGYFYGHADFQPGKRLSARVRAGVTSNLVGFQLEQTRSATGPGTPGQSFLLVPGLARVTLLTVSGRAQYVLSKDLRLDGELTRDTTRAPSGASLVNPGSVLTAATGGLSYAHQFRRWQLQARYATNWGSFDYGRLPSSRLRGHSTSAAVTLGSVRTVELVASALGSWQKTENVFLVQSRNWVAGLSGSRLLGAGWKLRASYNLEKSFFDSFGTRFASRGHVFSVFASHARGEFSVSRQLRDGLTFQPDIRLRLATPSQARTVLAAFPSVLAVPSSVSQTFLTATLRPTRRLSGRFLWNRNTQLLAGRVSNHYVQWEASVGYQFRALTLDVGHVRYAQDFGLGPFSRKRFFIRVVRDFHVF